LFGQHSAVTLNGSVKIGVKQKWNRTELQVLPESRHIFYPLKIGIPGAQERGRDPYTIIEGRETGSIIMKCSGCRECPTSIRTQ
jgi:hypothetical protein